MTITFSVLTPTWNRARYLRRVFEGLVRQSFCHFEWIVADDGSTDDTESVFRQLAGKAQFEILYIHADRHVGKARMDNEAVRRARGELILWCDSDDWLLPNALQRLWEAWSSIPASRKDEFVGLTALAATAQGVIANPVTDTSDEDVSWNDLAGIHDVTGDMLFCARADALKTHPFPEVDLVVPESVVWTAIGHRLTRLIPETLKMVEYRVAHSISFSGSMSYNRGRAYSLAETVRNLRNYPSPWTGRAWRLITFIRYASHGDIPVAHARRLWGSNSAGWLFWSMLPWGRGLAAKDFLQGKVNRTHHEFVAAQPCVRISVERFCPMAVP